MAVDKNNGVAFWDADTQTIVNVAPDGMLPVTSYIDLLEDRVSKLEERIKQLEEAYMEDKLLGKQT